MNTVVAGILGKLSPTLIERLASALSRPLNDARAMLFDAFEDHLEFALRRCETVKTIVSDERPIDLRSIYVPLSFDFTHKAIEDQQIFSNPTQYRRLIVKGTAGAGKTIFMKRYVLETLRRTDKIPIYIDLREIGDPRQLSLIKSIHKLCTPERLKDSYGVFDAGLRIGAFAFFFDGLDEVNPEYRETTFRQLQRLPFDYPKIEVTISSRPETDTSAFSVYEVVHVKPLTKPQTVNLLEKSQFHDSDKLFAFIESVRSGLFEQRKSFLSNPLLALLMLLVYSDSGEIPEHAAVFYEQAFDTLYSRHDSSKGPYKRKYKSGLPKTKLRSALQLFCYRTLARGLVAFDIVSMNNHAERVIEILQFDCETDDLIHDLIESICILHRDEGKIHFIHRSFQEYFAADFMAKWRSENRFKTMDTILSDGLGTRAGPLLRDIDEWALEEIWVVPVVKAVIAALEPQANRKTSVLIEELQISSESNELIGLSWRIPQHLFDQIRTLGTIYAHEFPKLRIPELNDIQIIPPDRDFRDWVSTGEDAPQEFKQLLRKEEKDKKRLIIEMKSRDAGIRNLWPLRPTSAHDAWLDNTSLARIIPDVFTELCKLRDSVSEKVASRLDLDVIN